MCELKSFAITVQVSKLWLQPQLCAQYYYFVAFVTGFWIINGFLENFAENFTNFN